MALRAEVEGWWMGGECESVLSAEMGVGLRVGGRMMGL